MLGAAGLPLARCASGDLAIKAAASVVLQIQHMQATGLANRITEHDVGAATCHLSRYSEPRRATRLRDQLRFLLSGLRVQ